MKRIVLIYSLFLGMAFPCPSFGQTPKMVVGGEIRELDQSRLINLSKEWHLALTNEIRTQLQKSKLKGITRVGRLDLSAFEKQLDEVRIVYVKSPAYVLGVGEFSARHFAVYIVETKTVYLNNYFFNDLTGPGLITHEILGAMGIDDQNYEVSTLFKSLDQSKAFVDQLNSSNPEFPKRLKTSPSRFYDNVKMGLKARKGGVTVVGGGGDGPMGDAKSFIFESRDSFRELFEVALSQEKLREALQFLKLPPGTDVQFSEADFFEFDKFLLETPIESMTPDQVSTIPLPLPNSEFAALNQIVYVSTVHPSTMHSSELTQAPYLRLSEKHWKTPFPGMTLSQSQKLTAFWSYTLLLLHWKIGVKLGEMDKLLQ